MLAQSTWPAQLEQAFQLAQCLDILEALLDPSVKLGMSSDMRDEVGLPPPGTYLMMMRIVITMNRCSSTPSKHQEEPLAGKAQASLAVWLFDSAQPAQLVWTILLVQTALPGCVPFLHEITCATMSLDTTSSWLDGIAIMSRYATSEWAVLW